MKQYFYNFVSKKNILLFFCLSLLIFPGLALAEGPPVNKLVIDCALVDPSTDSAGYCDNVDDLLLQAIQITKYLFQIIGVVALFAFVIGGFSMILSFGNAEKFKQGQKILVSAVVGLIIAFSAYILIGFVLESFTVNSADSGITYPGSTPIPIP